MSAGAAVIGVGFVVLGRRIDGSDGVNGTDAVDIDLAELTFGGFSGGGCGVHGGGGSLCMVEAKEMTDFVSEGVAKVDAIAFTAFGVGELVIGGI